MTVNQLKKILSELSEEQGEYEVKKWIFSSDGIGFHEDIEQVLDVGEINPWGRVTGKTVIEFI